MIALLMMLCSGCAGKEESAFSGMADKKGGTIRIGYFGPLSGRTEKAGRAALNGAKLAAEEVNQEGGINGSAVEIVAYDDMSNTSEAVKAAKALVEEDHVNAIYGSLHSGNMKAAGAYINEQKVLCVSGATSTSWPADDWEWLFRCTANERVSVEKLAEYAASLGLVRIATLTSHDNYGSNAAEELEKVSKRFGLEITEETTMENGDRNFSEQFEKIKKANPDAVFLWCVGDDLESVTRQMRQYGIVCPILGCEGYSLPELANVGNNGLNGVIFAAQFVVYDNPADAQENNMKEFLQKYIQTYGEAPKSDNAFRAYDGVKLIIEAMKKSGCTEGEGLRRAFREIDGYVGLAGIFSYKKMDHGEGIRSVRLFEIQNGTYREVW